MTKVLPEYPDYIIYEDARIFSTSTKKVFIRPGLTQDGYPQVNVKSLLAKNGYRHSIKVHRLVAKAFCPNPNNYKEVNHIDGNKLNNHYTNLEWCSRSHNIKHAFRLKLRSSEGTNNARAKISEWQVKAIRFLYKNFGYKQKDLGRIYGITQTHVGYIVNYKSWVNV